MCNPRQRISTPIPHQQRTYVLFGALNIEKALAEEAKAKEIERKTTFQRFEKSDLPEVHAAEQAAAIVGTNRQYVSDAKKIAQQAPERYTFGTLLVQLSPPGLHLVELQPGRRTQDASPDRGARKLRARPDASRPAGTGLA